MPPPAKRVAGRRSTVGILALVYGLAFVCGLLLFLAHRVYMRHVTFAQREFFWVGGVHEDASMGLRLRPRSVGFTVLHHGLRDPARRLAVRVDQLGCRVPVGADSTTILPGGIAAIGCSCTFGHGVAAESTYVELAGEMLGLPAYNLGVCGYSGVTSLLRLREVIAVLRPQWVVYGFGNFHFERATRPRADFDVYQAYVRADQNGCRITSPLFDNQLAFGTAERIESVYYLPRLTRESTAFNPERLQVVLPLAVQDLRRAFHPNSFRLRFERPDVPESTLCRFLVDEMMTTCRSHGASFALLFFPAFFGEEPSNAMLSAVKEHANDPDFLFVDSAPALFDGIRDQREYSLRWQVPRDGHPNRFMHLEMAKSLALVLPRSRSSRLLVDQDPTRRVPMTEDR